MASAVLVGIGAGAAALVPWPQRWIELWYAQYLYLQWQRIVTPVTNAVPFALFDLIVAVLGLGLLVAWLRAVRLARRMRSWAPAARAALMTTVVLGCVYLWFMAGWGLNYRREPILERLKLPATMPPTALVERLGSETVAALNALHAGAHAEGWPGHDERPPRLVLAFEEAQKRLAPVHAAIAGRPKRSVFGSYFRWTSVDGMVDPFALEVMVNPDLLPLERPFVFGHEWAHLAGYADESEASFVGFLTCLRAGAAPQYSAWLAMYWEIVSELPAGSRAALDKTLHAGPRADLRAIAERIRRGGIPLLRRAGWEAYDRYLRANRVEGGIRSYGLVVRLVVAGRPLWQPVK